jgi:hypothetical protein
MKHITYKLLEWSKNKCLWKGKNWGFWIAVDFLNWNLLLNLELNFLRNSFRIHWLCFYVDLFKWR